MAAAGADADLCPSPESTKAAGFKLTATIIYVDSEATGNNTDFSMNFIPKMSYQKLIHGYKEILDTIYSPKEFYNRVKTFLQEYERPFKKQQKLKFRL